MAEPSADARVRYEPDERPPIALTLGSGLQAALVIVAPVVITVVIVARIAGQPDAYIAFAAFAALLVSGATTALQAVRVGYIGSGHVLIMGTSGAFIAVCVAALAGAGPPHGVPRRRRDAPALGPRLRAAAGCGGRGGARRPRTARRRRGAAARA